MAMAIEAMADGVTAHITVTAIMAAHFTGADITGRIGKVA